MNIADGRARLQVHVLQGARHAVALDGILLGGGIRHLGVDGDHHFRRGAPTDLRLEFPGLDLDHGVEGRAGIAVQLFPVVDSAVPELAGRRQRPALEVGQRGVVDGDDAGAGAGLDGHVAQRHAAFHRQRPHGRAGELDGVARAAGGADPADDGEDDVLGGHAVAEGALDLDQHRFRLALHQALGGQRVFDLGGADAERQRAKGAVRGGVRIAADDGHARQGGALLGTHHVHHALTFVAHGVFGDAEFGAVAVQGFDLQPGDGIGDAPIAVLGRHVVVGGGQVRAGAPGLAAAQSQALERLGRGDFMQQLTVDVDQRRAIRLGADHMGVPEFVVKGFAGHKRGSRLG